MILIHVSLPLQNRDRKRYSAIGSDSKSGLQSTRCSSAAATPVELENIHQRGPQTRCGIVFDRYYAGAGMSIGRFGSIFISQGGKDYVTSSGNSHSSKNLKDVICRNLIGMDAQTGVCDCDRSQFHNVAPA